MYSNDSGNGYGYGYSTNSSSSSNNISSISNLQHRDTSNRDNGSGSSSGSGLDDLYKQANKLLFSIRNDLETLETGTDTSVIIQSKLSTNINQLSRLSDQIDGMVSNEPIAKREIWRILLIIIKKLKNFRKVKQLVEESKSLRKSLDMFLQTKYKKQMEEEEKNKLMGRRKAGESSAIGNLMKENKHLNDGNSTLDSLTEMGNSIIYNLVGQNSKLKGVNKKIYDIANTLGLSRSVIQRIKRRQHQDKVIVYSGMVIVLIIVFLLWYFFRK
ncbi:v-SNARE family protein [Dictyostelium discoideum AX4]|uniref:V-SNARE family protein n=1 Tax=Dictyostelium discoideum TaxID=44689 RepID=Q55FD0_DICDI|nr:v-SNARE family protein [Dictyostelium discoideum AX4]EAL73679.1 v-SNARE family protein [Dictyostelium discoideum AX4]|eukprot:XP_647603.1 v-SNARE family protein [Dictyostelium discoideum AX4]